MTFLEAVATAQPMKRPAWRHWYVLQANRRCPWRIGDGWWARNLTASNGSWSGGAAFRPSFLIDPGDLLAEDWEVEP